MLKDNRISQLRNNLKVEQGLTHLKHPHECFFSEEVVGCEENNYLNLSIE